MLALDRREPLGRHNSPLASWSCCNLETQHLGYERRHVRSKHILQAHLDLKTKQFTALFYRSVVVNCGCCSTKPFQAEGGVWQVPTPSFRGLPFAAQLIPPYPPPSCFNVTGRPPLPVSSSFTLLFLVSLTVNLLLNYPFCCLSLLPHPQSFIKTSFLYLLQLWRLGRRCF